MTPKRTSAAEMVPSVIAPVRVVIVTMDSHLSSAAARAESALARDIPGLTLAVHAADEWGSDGEALAACHRDIAGGDIVIATMLFMEDHIRPVLPALQARRADCDAMLCCMSAGEVTKLTKLGRFDMAQEATGALAMLKRLRGGTKAGVPASGQAQMKMLKRLPKLMRFIPGTAQDVRTYFLALQYWLAGSDENIGNLVRMLVGRYASGERRALAGKVAAAAPVEYPEVGLYHPAAPGRVVERLDQLPRGGLAGTVGAAAAALLPHQRQRQTL